MELFTVVNDSSDTIKCNSNIFIKKMEYSSVLLEQFIDVIKHYYVKMVGESEDTDFNDRYSSSWTNIFPCNLENVVIKDDKVFGFIVSGLNQVNEKLIVLTFDNDHYNYYDGSCYSYIEKDYYLKKYDFDSIYLDIAVSHKVKKSYKIYKIIDGKEVLDTEGEQTFDLTAFDIKEENGNILIVKNDILFKYKDENSYIQENVKEYVLGVVSYREYFIYSLIKL